MPLTFNKGGTTVTPEYQPAEVYANDPQDKVPAPDTSDLSAISIGARFSAPTAFDGEDIVIKRTIRSTQVVANGTSGATTQTGRATSGGSGTGLTVNVTAAGGVVTAVAINNQGNGAYKLGELITITNSTAAASPTFRITLMA